MKKKIVLEYPLNVSPKILYPRLSTPGGLAEWFADDVNISGKNYVFIWDNTEYPAEILQRKENKYIKFRWLNETDPNAYFEFRITVDELTNDVALIITDFVEENEVNDSIELWNTQVERLKHTLGI